MLRRFAPRNDVEIASPSRGALRPSFARNFPPPSNRGRREDRVRAAPAVSCASCTKQNAHEHTGQRRTPGLPCAMALRLMACSPRRTAVLPPLRPGKSNAPRCMDASNATSGPHAFAVRLRHDRLRDIGVHRNPPNVRDDGRRPSDQDRMGVDVALISNSVNTKYFSFRGLTRIPKSRSADLPVGSVCRSL